MCSKASWPRRRGCAPAPRGGSMCLTKPRWTPSWRRHRGDRARALGHHGQQRGARIRPLESDDRAAVGILRRRGAAGARRRHRAQAAGDARGHRRGCAVLRVRPGGVDHGSSLGRRRREVTDLAAVLARLERDHARILAELVEFAAIPSVSTDPAHATDLRAAAAWVAAKLAAAGPFTVRIMPTPGASVVYAEWLAAPGAPTALIYGHYHLQPQAPAGQWHNPPLRPTLREGRLYGRGVSDDKGPLLIPIKAAAAFFAERARLPLNLKFLIEGEEDIRSRHLAAVLTGPTDTPPADPPLPPAAP